MVLDFGLGREYDVMNLVVEPGKVSLISKRIQGLSGYP